MFGRKHNIIPKVLSGRHGLIANTTVSPPNAVIVNSDDVDPSPSTSEGHRVQELVTPSGTGAGRPKDAPIKKRDGKMAMALKALKEEVARQAEEQRQRDMLMLAEIKKSNELKEKANALRAEKNQLLSKQVILLQHLLNKDI
ncbi:uncharacterized protein LOC124164984 [Ischnura elegans]|uniref:uncharacterized protein LOC124164984 n=1 Tax=Ischnura elegans TaxID=197161 RepID=UPI001ED89D6D|nr:uncharacterized protein LOC124164984 [Ischnura elegans]